MASVAGIEEIAITNPTDRDFEYVLKNLDRTSTQTSENKFRSN